MTEQTDLISLELGERLRVAREQRGIELQAVAAATRLSEKTLKIIEDGKWNLLPGVYRAGYARNYAAFLGLPLEEYQEEIKKLSVQGTPELQSVFPEGIKINKMDKNLRILSYLVMSIFVVLPLVWIYTKTAADLSQPDALSISDPSGLASTRQNSLDIPRQEGTGGVEPAIPKHMEANVIPTQSLGNRNEIPGEEAAEGTFNNRVATDNNKTGGTGQVLDVRLKADSWVVVTDASGKRLEYDLLRGGNSYSYTGIAPFDILIGRASAVELSIEGQQVDLGPYISGNVASLELDVAAKPAD